MRSDAICVEEAGSPKLKAIRPGCMVRRSPPTLCMPKRQITSYTPPISSCWLPYTHRDCTHNEYVAIRNRVIGDVPQPTQAGLQWLHAEARQLSRQIPETTQMSYGGFLDHYSGRRRARYEQAVTSLTYKPLDPIRESYISAFVKAEKFDPAAKTNPDPRMIQARNSRFNTEIGLFLKPIEHHLYRLKDATSGLPLIGKGLNHQARGSVLAKKFRRFKKGVCFSIDASRFDQHVARQVLEVEHSVYLRSNNDSYFRTLLKQQLKNRCFTRNGWGYSVDGGRMSGDMNTALGNCVLMVCMVRAAMKQLNVVNFDIFDDGDDCLVFCEEEDFEVCNNGMIPVFLEFGQELKIENVARSLEEVVWCQCRVVEGLDGDMQMCADWRKVLSQSCAGVIHWDKDNRKDMAFSVGQCLLAVYPGMPIIHKYATRLCSTGGSLHKDIFNTDWLYKLAPTGLGSRLGTLFADTPTQGTRSSFAAAYGIDEIEQLRIEEALDNWMPCVDLPVIAGHTVNGSWEWKYPLGCHPTDRDVIPPNCYIPSHAS